MKLLLDRSDAIRDLIASTPAKTIGDVAVQIFEIAHLAGRLSNFGHTQKDVSEEAKKIESLCYAMLPVAAKSAGLDMSQMHWESEGELRAMRWAGVGVKS